MALNLPKFLSDHPSLVGIVRFPSCTFSTQEVDIPIVAKIDNTYMQVLQRVDMAISVTRTEKESISFSIPKTNITDFYPYTYYVLTDNESDPLIMYPQYLPSSISIKGKFALSNQPVERYYPTNYKGDTTGNVYNITNTNQMMLPTATNEGLAYLNANANAMAQGRKNQITGNVLNGLNVVGSAIATGGLSLVGGGVSSVITGMQEIKQTDARNKDIMLTPSTISSFGTPSTRLAFGTDSVRLIKYTIKENVKTKINNYVNRYGNKYNNYGVIDLKTYKGYIKFLSPKVESKIDNMYLNKIQEILQRGVYIE